MDDCYNASDEELETLCMDDKILLTSSISKLTVVPVTAEKLACISDEEIIQRLEVAPYMGLIRGLAREIVKLKEKQDD